MAIHAVCRFFTRGEQIKKQSADPVPVKDSCNEFVSWAVSAAAASVGKKHRS
jgi:hypothetical protein